LAAARASLRRVSEAARLSRLYWWTAEYGLIGKSSDYKLYGAGLLSSLWESFACHDPKVRKLPISVEAGEVEYDVTRPQPQLFVTPSFEQLHDVLDEVVRGLPSARGGEPAFAEAAAAQEVATLDLAGGLQLLGVLARRVTSGGVTTLLRVAGPARASLAGERVDADVVHAVMGDSRAALTRLAAGRIDLTLAHGVRLRGELSRAHAQPGQGAALLVMKSGELYAASSLDERLAPGHVVVLSDSVLGAHAGAPSDFFPESELPEVLVPKAHSLPPRERELLGLYEAALEALRSSGASATSEIESVFERVHGELGRRFEHDWLLRWNLLESLQKLGVENRVTAELRRELEQLEVYYQYRQPIASGLSYLSRVAQKPRGG
jgi:hypothetical protein